MQVVEEVACVVDSWRDAAKKAGISAADVELTAAAFSAHSEYRAQQNATHQASSSRPHKN